MFKLKEFTKRINEAREFLEEKLIQFNGGKKYGQVVFLAGGAGSGKGFAVKQFMEGDKFKIRDVDEMKSAFLKLDKLTGKYPEIRGLDLRKPDDVYKLHMFVKEKGIKDKTLEFLMTGKNKKHLPNVIFDITAKDFDDITDVVPMLHKVGYETRDIHIAWILTDYKVAMQNNADRSRVVPLDVLLGTHMGAANTMTGIIQKNKVPRSMVDGGIYVVLNNRENTIVWGKDKTDKFVVKSFSYLTIKKPGKAIEAKQDVLDQLGQWVKANAPTQTDAEKTLAGADDSTLSGDYKKKRDAKKAA